jgi:hypothetical protein
MSGPGGIPPVILPLFPTLGDLPLARAGQPVQTVVQGSAGSPFIQVAGQQIPLDSVGIVPGMVVSVEMMGKGDEARLRITPHIREGAAATLPTDQVRPATAPSAVAALQHSAEGPAQAAVGGRGATHQGNVPRLTEMVVRVLESLQSLDRTAPAVQVVTPGRLPLTEQAVRQIVGLFVSRGSLGEDLALVRGMMRQAAADGILSTSRAIEVDRFFSGLMQTTEDGFDSLIERLFGRTATGTESRLAHLASMADGMTARLPEALADDLRAFLSRLASDESLLEHLDGRGQRGAFNKAVGQILDRLSGINLQNLRGLAQTYHFLEIPFAPGAPVQFAQVHFFGEGGPGQHAMADDNATVVLDLSTSRLGDLWVSMTLMPAGEARRCMCTFRATSSSAAAVLQEHAPELQAAFNDIGYPGSQVRVTLWDGDRLRETASLMARFAGLDMSA